MIKIWFKSTCSTCRTALSLIREESDDEISIVEYTVNVPTQKDIKEVLKMLGLKAEDIVRKKEELYKKKFANKKLSNSEWIKVLVKNPILIERPIVIRDGKAIIGRPATKVLEIFK
ncbi:MAG TPA: ArsC/Spx/MgsR family protein [Bacteroidia bacterium]|nr:ArsC/Spx/MgsR family protein [Bacteroidia bacterium]HNS11757.1 ArsC/Spx/MgsR family protein [Bacteroidia bacterium]